MMDSSTIFDARLDLVPTSPGVYLMKDASGLVIYVGKAKNLKKRLSSYFNANPAGNAKVLAMISHIADFEFIVVNTELEALILESNLIKKHYPQYNILLRDDKGYPYVCITMNEMYPRIFKAFRIGFDKKEGAKYYGPFLAGDVFHVLKTIKGIFPLKTCRRVLPRDIGKERPCLNYHIGKCIAPCKGDVKAEDYRFIMHNICLFFEGRYDGIQKDLKEKMLKASETQAYETAVLYRDRLQSLEKIMVSQKVSLSNEQDIDIIAIEKEAGEICVKKLEVRSGRLIGSLTYFLPDEMVPLEEVISAFIEQHYVDEVFIPEQLLLSHMPADLEWAQVYFKARKDSKIDIKVPQRGDKVDLLSFAKRNAKEALMRRVLRVGDSQNAISLALESLANVCQLESIPQRIEAYDISNLGDDDKAGGMVVFVGGKPDKASYRKFKIKEAKLQDDYAGMKEMLRRRFSSASSDKTNRVFPDLILIDGGSTHVSLAQSVLQELNLKIPVAGMVKNHKHATRGLALPNDKILELALEAKNNHESLILLRLLTAIQNEVHRYALSYQRQLSKKRNLSFKLENIQGIGPAKRRSLLDHFITIGQVTKASVEELMQAKGISADNAKAIYAYFHTKEKEE